ncbi:MAG: hypothetical protein NTW87_20495, partial [Planctomycetota bacterium]|nr:hypothetical protein [Planctomycetota bacterium]
LAVADGRLLAREVPHASLGWGWPVVAMAFAVFGLAFWITRRSLVPQPHPEPDASDAPATS